MNYRGTQYSHNNLVDLIHFKEGPLCVTKRQKEIGIVCRFLMPNDKGFGEGYEGSVFVMATLTDEPNYGGFKLDIPYIIKNGCHMPLKDEYKLSILQYLHRSIIDEEMNIVNPIYWKEVMLTAQKKKIKDKEFSDNRYEILMKKMLCNPALKK